MSEYELISLIRETVNAANQDFEFFLTATFAVIVASYTVGKRLNTLPRIVLALVYLVATILFYLRYDVLASQAGYYFQQLADLGSDFPTPPQSLHAILRKSLMIVGSLATMLLVFRPLTVNAERKYSASDVD